MDETPLEKARELIKDLDPGAYPIIELLAKKLDELWGKVEHLESQPSNTDLAKLIQKQARESAWLAAKVDDLRAEEAT